MYFDANVMRGATVQFLPQNAPETAWRPGSAWTRWGNLQTYSTLRGIGREERGEKGK